MTAQEFKSIFDKFRMHVFFYCNKCINDRMQAEDITSMVFIKLWENSAYHNFPDEDSLKGYLFLLAKRKCRDYLLTAKRRHQREEIFELNNADLEQIEINAEIINYIRTLIETLAPKQKRIFKLKYYEDKDVKEISELLHISPQTVSNTLHTSMNILRTTLKNRGINHG